MFQEIIDEILAQHDEFSASELEEICQVYYDEIDPKIKHETRLKRTAKYMRSEFELSDAASSPFAKGNGVDYGSGVKNGVNYSHNKQYSLDTIPKYLFEGKSAIVSSLIDIVNLTKSIGAEPLLIDAHLKINTNDKVALIGKNGAGKTMLLKMILAKAGILKGKQAEILDLENIDGSIELASGIKIGYLSQDLFWSDTRNTLGQEMASIFPDITKKIQKLHSLQDNQDAWEERENLNKELIACDGFKKDILRQEILRYFGITDDQLEFNVLMLSGGEQTKVQIAKFLISEVDILILDEPTNHLDIEGIIFLEKFCQVWNKAIVSISHDVQFINNTCKRIAEISGKQIHNYAGNYDYYIKEKQERYDKQIRDYTNQQREIDTQEAYINRFRANSAKASSVQSRIKALDKVERLHMPENETTAKFITLQPNLRLPEVIMKLEDVIVGYDYPLVILPEFIEVHKQDKIGIIGKNGAGKSTLLKTILGELEALSGTSKIHPKLKIGSYGQVLEGLDMSMSIIAELGKDYGNQQDIRTMLGGLLITGDKVLQDIGTLSGGERAKVALSKMLLARPDIIIMDEPTNHLDIHSKEVIKNMLRTFTGTTLIVSHDRDLLESVSNKLWYIKEQTMSVYDETEKGFREVY